MSAVAEQEIQETVVGDDALVIEGTEQLSFEVGGKQPLASKLKVAAGAIEVEGQFRKGETVTLMVECVVNEVTFKDVADKATGQVVDCVRVQKARVEHVAVVENAVTESEPDLFSGITELPEDRNDPDEEFPLTYPEDFNGASESDPSL